MADDVQLTFNRGVVSPLALARVDIKRVAMSAEEQCNWIARTLGPMSVRPGLGYLGATKSNAAARYLPFVFSTSDTALVELTNNIMRVWVNDALITRPTVATAITNGTVTTDLSSWTDVDDVGGVSAWATGGYMGLTGDGTNAAAREQTVSVALGDRNVEHALKIRIVLGTVRLRVGSTSGGEEYIAETELGLGYHSLSFTPTGANCYVRFLSRKNYLCYVDECTIDAAGTMEIITSISSDLLGSVRCTQSGDVLFLACGITHQQQRIERRSSTSWSVVDYVSETGPFRAPNTGPITLAPSALNGTITLTPNKPFFKASHQGALFKITSNGQTVLKSISAADVYSNEIRVSGIETARIFALAITGVWVATVTLQRSPGAPGSWTDVTSYTTNQAISVDDGFDNQIIYYRIGIKTGSYTSGTAAVTLSISTGSISGIAFGNFYVSATQMNATVLQDFGSTTATTDWSEGAWSPLRGYPSAGTFFGGRLWWAGKDRVYGSVVDAFDDFDEDYVGDAGPINRSIGAGPVDTINWLLPLQTLTMGAQGAEFLCRSSSLEEPLTPTNFNLREATTYGSSAVEAAKVDAGGVFIDRTGSRVMEVATDSATLETKELTVINPEICLPSIVRMGVQRRPDTRIHLVRSDGVVVMLVFDRAEDVKCLLTVETDGLVEDVVVLPGVPEDQVYYVVNRTVNGSTVRYLERWALTSEAVGGVINKMADAYKVYSGVSTTTITGLSHLIGETVVCWANSKDQGTFTVSGAGTITLPEATTYAVTGLGYEARFKSSKVGISVFGPTVISQNKRVDRLGLILANTHYQGLRYGQDAAHLDDLPLMENGVETAADYVWSNYNESPFPVNGSFQSPDARLYLKGAAPRPCTVLAAVVSVDKGSR
jgi:hypothetical protein